MFWIYIGFYSCLFVLSNMGFYSNDHLFWKHAYFEVEFCSCLFVTWDSIVFCFFSDYIAVIDGILICHIHVLVLCVHHAILQTCWVSLFSFTLGQWVPTSTSIWEGCYETPGKLINKLCANSSFYWISI